MGGWGGWGVGVGWSCSGDGGGLCGGICSCRFGGRVTGWGQQSHGLGVGGFLHHNCCFHHLIFSLLRVYAHACGFESASIVVNVDG